MRTQFIIDDLGNKIAVILPVKDYEKMLDELEEKEDIKLYDLVKSRKEERIPLEQYLSERKRKRKNA